MTLSRKRLRLNSLIFLALIIAFFILLTIRWPTTRGPITPSTSIVLALFILMGVAIAAIVVLKRKAAPQAYPILSPEREQQLTDEDKALVEKYGLELTLALTNTARLEIIRVLIENPQGLTKREIGRLIGSTNLASLLESHLEALHTAKAIRIEEEKYYSLVDEEAVKLMESAKENEYSMYYDLGS